LRLKWSQNGGCPRPHIIHTHLGVEHEDWLAAAGRANFFRATKALYELMQDAHPKTLSCCVVAKAQRGTANDGKGRKLNVRIEAAGEPGAPLHLKIKAYHMDVEGGAESAGFPMEEIAVLLMSRQWYQYLNAIDPQGTRPTDDVIKEVTKRATQYYTLLAEHKTE
jgi:ribosomal protein S6E (S10)